MDNNLSKVITQDKQEEQWNNLATATKESSFENMRVGRKLHPRDIAFLGIYFVIVVVLASIIFGICFAFGVTSAWIVYVIFVLLYFISWVYLLWSTNGKKHWELLYGRINMARKPRVYSLNDLEKIIPVKALAVDPVNNTANTFFTSHDLNGPVIKYFKIIADSVGDLSDKDLLAKVQGWGSFFTNVRQIDRKHGIRYDITSFNTGVFDTTKQLKVKDEARRKKTDPVSLTLISEDYEMYENLASFLTPENEPTIFRFDQTPFNLINRYYVLAIKGSNYTDVNNYANIMIDKLIEETGAEIKPFSFIDAQSLLNKYYGNIINFKLQHPSQTKVALADIDDYNEYDIYNITRNTKDETDLPYSMLDSINKVRVHKDYLEITRNTKDESKRSDYVMTVGFKDLPNNFPVGWLNDFTSSNLGVMVTQKLNSEKERLLNKKLRKQIARNNAVWKRASSSIKLDNDYENTNSTINHQRSVEFAQVVNDGNISLLDYRFYFIIRGNSPDELYSIRNSFDILLNKSLGIDEDKREHYEFKQLEAFLSAFPDGIDFMSYSKSNNNWITSVALAQSYPYHRNIDFLDEGILIGIDDNYSRLIIINNLDPSLANSYHMAIFASTGSGKSKLAQEICMMYATFRKPVKVWFFDANKDYIPLTEQMGGDVIYTDPSKTSMKPYAENKLAQELPFLMGNGTLETLLNIRVQGVNIVQRRPLIQKGPGYYLLISNKDFAPDQLRSFFEKNYNTLSSKKKEEVLDLYAEIYLRCVKKFLLNPFRILDLNGEEVDAQTGITSQPTALSTFETHLKNLNQWFVVLLQNWAGVHSEIIEDAIINTYKRVNRFSKQTDPVTKTAFLGRSSSRSDEVSLDELLNQPRYPVFSDFYEELVLLANEQIAQDDDPASKTRYRDLLKVLKKFAIVRRNGKTEAGTMADLWNTDNGELDFNANYTCFVTDAIASSQESEPFTDDKSVRTTIDSIGRAQFFLMVTLFRSRSRKNGLMKIGRRMNDQPFLLLVWDEAHNLIKHPLIEASLLRLSKEGRKDNTGVLLITQDVGDVTRLKSGKGIMNQFATKVYLGMGASGIKELDDLLSAIGGLKQITINWLINPRGHNTDVFRGDINLKPPGYAVISPNNADIFQIRFRTFYRIIDEMLTGSNLFVGSVSIFDIWQYYERGFYPLSSLDDPAHPRKMLPSHVSIIRRAKKWYEENQALSSTTGLQQTSNMIRQNDALSQTIPVDIDALIQFDTTY